MSASARSSHGNRRLGRRRSPRPAGRLGGLLKHLAYIENDYFEVRPCGLGSGPPWDVVDWDADRDWHSAADDTPEQLYTLSNNTVARSRALVAEVMSEGGLDQVARGAWTDGQKPSLRRILIDLIRRTH